MAAKIYWNTFKTYRLAIGSLAIVAFLILFALLVPLLTPHDEPNLSMKNHGPNATFWFGTDELGRDLLTRVAWGARVSLFVGFVATLIDCVVGVLYGSVAGIAGGKTGEWMMRIADILYSIPYLLVVILLMVLLGPGLKSVLIGLTFTGWITMARIVRNQIEQLKQYEYVKAAYGMGASSCRILFHHLLPNALGSIIVTATFTIPAAIFAEAFLSFLGLGVQAPNASWGTLAYDGLVALRFYPWRLFIPAVFISLTILCLNLIGDTLRDVFDQRVSQ